MIARSLMAACLFLGCYSLVLWLYPTNIPIVGHSFQINNLVRAERIAFGSAGVSNLLVGSSLSGAISLKQLPSGFTSLAFDAGGPLTGLEVLAASSKIPRTVFVEMNVADQPCDDSVVSHVSQPPWAWLRSYVPLFRTSNQPMNLFRSWVAFRIGSTRKISNPVRVAEGLEYYRSNFSRPPDTALLKKNLARMARIVALLRNQGCAVAMVEFPIHPDLRSSERHRVMIEECQRFFPERDFSWVRPTEGVEYQTTDGHHLDTPSGDRFIRELAEFAHMASRGATGGK